MIHDVHAGLVELPLVSIDLNTVQTNIIIFNLKPGAPEKAAFLRNLWERHGVLMTAFFGGIRAVTHYDVGSADCAYALRAVEDCLQLGAAQSNGEVCGKAKADLHHRVNGSLKDYE